MQEVSRVGAQGVTSKSKLLAREMPDLHTGAALHTDRPDREIFRTAKPRYGPPVEQFVGRAQQEPWRVATHIGPLAWARQPLGGPSEAMLRRKRNKMRALAHRKPRHGSSSRCARPKMRPRSRALVMKALLVLNKHSAVAHEVGGHRIHA